VGVGTVVADVCIDDADVGVLTFVLADKCGGNNPVPLAGDGPEVEAVLFGVPRGGYVL
jgi:hypothetical protein